MNVLNMLQKNLSDKPTAEKIGVPIGKVWVKENERFSMAKLSVKNPNGDGYVMSDMYPFVVTDYTDIVFGRNKKLSDNPKQNSHWVFLNMPKDKLNEYTKLCKQIGMDKVVDELEQVSANL